jgi:hypothetical protein
MSSEQSLLSRLVSDFAEVMRDKLWKKHVQGYRGWNDGSDTHLPEHFRDLLLEHVNKYIDQKNPAQLVDIACIVAMLWRIEVQSKETKTNYQITGGY